MSTPYLVNKLIQLKHDLKHSNKKVFGNVEERTKSLMEEIQSLGYLEEGRTLVEEDRVGRAKATADLENVALMHEVS